MPAAALAAAVLAAFLAVSPALAEPEEASVECIATAVYYEARGEDREGKEAVANVVLNRAEHDEFPATPCAVVEDGCEFSFMCDGQPERMADPDDREAAFATAEAAVEGDLPDPTGGALFFHARSVQLDWFETLERVGAIGGHVFYR